ncbi:hypothetical protein CMO91_05535 [Candidatus Woesearchaeota archaeon]|nr:hypothetical protein [Candidatus Woesearchaeota archaeon]|tara:strand:+ start:139 stop:537 length:399 start_codon:yes stop_codon:yes gene_type:complete
MDVASLPIEERIEKEIYVLPPPRKFRYGRTIRIEQDPDGTAPMKQRYDVMARMLHMIWKGVDDAQLDVVLSTGSLQPIDIHASTPHETFRARLSLNVMEDGKGPIDIRLQSTKNGEKSLYGVFCIACPRYGK